MSKAVSQRASANSLRGAHAQHKRHVSLRHLPGQQESEDHLTPHQAPRPRSADSAHSGTIEHTSVASNAEIRHPHTHHTRRMTEADAQHIDQLLESEGEEGVDLIGIVERQDVFHLIHLIRDDLRKTIDTHLTWEELTSVDLNFSLVRPLAIKYSDFRSIAILYCLMLNRIHFQNQGNRDIAFQSVNTTRAALCELLAMKLLRTFSNDGLELVTSLTASFHPLAGATPEEISELALSSSSIDKEEIKTKGLPPTQFSNTLELAISSSAKRFISTPLCQRCIDGIWHGKVVLSPLQASHAILNDSYKKRPLSIYDPIKAPLLNHLRLRVPSIRSKLEFCTFVIILVLYVAALAQKGSPTWTVQETFFSIWLFGFVVDELAQLLEHGLHHYVGSLYNLLDLTFCAIALFWFSLRVTALRYGTSSAVAFDCLALGAVILCPRVASCLVQDNVVLLSLKAMLADFAFFTVLAAICFSGFAYAFYSLASETRWTFKAILWLMLKVWFGSSYLGFDEAKSFSLEFGPPLMILYTILSNTLLLTVLISLLSNTFTIVAMNANEEAMFQFACKTMAGITTDAIFSYQPPLNLLAVVIIMPLSYLVTPRWLHKINVFLIRLANFPVLLIIRYCELTAFGQGISLTADKSRTLFSLTSWMPIVNSRFDRGGNDVIEAAFEYQSCDKDETSMESGDEVEADLPASGKDDRLQTATNGGMDAQRPTQMGTNADVISAPAASQSHKSQNPPETIPRSDTVSSMVGSISSFKGPKRRSSQLRKSHDSRALGSLSSPLAKLFNRAYTPETGDSSGSPTRSRFQMMRSMPPSSSDLLIRAKDRAPSSDGDRHVEVGVEAGSQLPDTSYSRDTVDAEMRTVAQKMAEMEARGKRIEDLLLRLLETRS